MSSKVLLETHWMSFAFEGLRFYRHLTSLCLGIFDLFTSLWPWPWLSRSWCPWSHNKLSLHHLNEKLRRHYNRTSVIEVVNVSSSKKVKLFKIETRIWLLSQSSSLVWSLSLFFVFICSLFFFFFFLFSFFFICFCFAFHRLTNSSCAFTCELQQRLSSNLLQKHSDLHLHVHGYLKL